MKESLHYMDKHRIIAMPGNAQETLTFSVEKWIEIANESIEDHGFFAVALSGGSTPKKIFQELSSPKLAKLLDWSQVLLFWSDERSVSPDDPTSNFHMAMQEGGLSKLPIPPEQIFRMVAETDIEKNAEAYENIIKKQLGSNPLDLVMLGMGDDGHTASLFPHTEALTEKEKWVVANHVPQKETWRMTFTYPCINSSRYICIYVMGGGKAETLEKVFTSPLDPDTYPSQLLGSNANPVVWIVDDEAGKLLLTHLKA